MPATVALINQSLSTPLPFSTPQKPISASWDNACSYSVTNDRTLFTNLYPLHPALHIGGVGGSCLATHAGYLSCLPAVNHMNLGLYCPSTPQTLLSLGHIHSCGGSFSTTASPNALTIFANPATPLATTALKTHSNLYPANIDALRDTLRQHPHLTIFSLDPSLRSSLPPRLRHFVSQHPPTVPYAPTPFLHAFNFNLSCS